MFISEERLSRVIREAIDNVINNEPSAYDEFMESETMRYKIIGYLMFKEGYIIHGGKQTFDKFDTSLVRGGGRGVYGYGAYFASEPYKCIEYGTNFVMTKKDDYYLLDLEKAANEQIFNNLLSEIAQLKDTLENSRNIREYDEAQAELDRIGGMIDTTILYSAMSILREEGGMTFENLNKILQNRYEQKDIANIYKAYGFDGFKAANQYVIFNFDKLNQNLEILTKERIEEIARNL